MCVCDAGMWIDCDRLGGRERATAVVRRLALIGLICGRAAAVAAVAAANVVAATTVPAAAAALPPASEAAIPPPAPAAAAVAAAACNNLSVAASGVGELDFYLYIDG